MSVPAGQSSTEHSIGNDSERQEADAVERAGGEAQIVALRLCVAIKETLAERSAKRDRSD